MNENIKKTLRLSLKKQWFEMTKSGVKTEDYREITPYWCNRFLLQNGKKHNLEWWRKYLNWYDKRDLEKAIKENNEIHRLSFIEFETNTMTLGYPKKSDTEKIIKFEHKGILIRTGFTEWGAETNRLYFVIQHGSAVE